MDDLPLCIFSLERGAVPLRVLRDALRSAEFPMSVGVGIAGDATTEELDAPDWEAAFLRWKEPAVHEVALLERLTRDADSLAEEAVQETLSRLADHPDAAGRLIVTDHLTRCQTVYAWQLMPALIADDNHSAWAALDVALRAIAESSEGIIYAQAEGFYDAEGEMLLAEDDDEDLTGEEDEDA